MKKSTQSRLVLIFIIISGIIALAPSMASAQDQPTMSIPALGINSVIADSPIVGNTWDLTNLHWQVTHLQGMPWFGSQANIPIAGHSTDIDGNPDIFYNLHLLVPGDEIIFNVNGVEYRYIVDHLTTVSQYDLSILNPRGASRVTLFTCTLGSFNPDSNEFEERTVVVAYAA